MTTTAPLTPTPGPGHAARVLSMVSLESVRTDAATRMRSEHTNARPGYVENPDWNDHGWSEAFRAVFRARLDQARPDFLLVPKSERPALIAAIVNSLMPETGPLPVAHGSVLPFLVGHGSGVIPETVRRHLSSRCLETAAETIRHHGHANAMHSLFTATQLGSPGIVEAGKAYFLRLLRARSDSAIPGDESLPPIREGVDGVRNVDWTEIKDRILADPEVIELGRRYLVLQLTRNPSRLREEARLLGQEAYLETPEFVAAVPAAAVELLTVPENGVPREEPLRPDLGATVVLVPLLPLHAPGVTGIPAETAAMLRRLEARAEAAVLSVLEYFDPNYSGWSRPIQGLADAVALMTSGAFRNSEAFGRTLFAAAGRVRIDRYDFDEFAREIIRLAPPEYLDRIEGVMRRQVETRVPRIIGFLGEVRATARNAPLSDLVRCELQYLARCVTEVTLREPDAERSLALCGIDTTGLGRVAAALIEFTADWKAYRAGLSEQIARFRGLLGAGRIATKAGLAAMRKIGKNQDAQSERRDAGPITQTAEALGACLGIDGGKFHLASMSRAARLGFVADSLEATQVAERLHGIPRLELFTTAAALRAEAGLLPNTAPRSELEPREPELDEHFWYLRRCYLCYRQWGDRELAEDALRDLQSFWRTELQGADTYRDEVLDMERRHLTWIGDRRGLAETGVEIAERTDASSLDRMDRVSRRRHFDHLLDTGTAFLSLANPTASGSTGRRRDADLQQAARLFRRALEVEQHLHDSALVDAAVDEPDSGITESASSSVLVRGRLAIVYLEIREPGEADELLARVAEILARPPLRAGSPEMPGRRELDVAESGYIVESAIRLTEELALFEHHREAVDLLRATLPQQRLLLAESSRWWGAPGSQTRESPLVRNGLRLAHTHARLGVMRAGLGELEAAVGDLGEARETLRRYSLDAVDPDFASRVKIIQARVHELFYGRPTSEE